MIAACVGLARRAGGRSVAGAGPTAGLYWLIAGGLAYTVGVAFFATDSRLRYGHFAWHLFVMIGTACHYFAVFWYAG